MAPLHVFAALALVCLGVASQPDCNELVKPMVNLSSSVGKWILHAATTDSEPMTAQMENYTSSWLHVKRIPDGNPQIAEIANKVNGGCVYIQTNVSAVGDKLLMALNLENQNLEFNGQFYETCPDCLLWSDTVKWFGPTEIRRLLLFTKTGNMTLPNLERFKQQASCLNFTLGLHMTSDTDLCPEEKEEIAVKEDQ
ncbi:hypothetical protein NHX12_028512 [Muraenolepis orangiensis]|uniref:Apolipoprotein M n=1 Tax=Muraenolepis orangiensis TaxID=630683 RepID=A0A9Q0EBJ9_9TELE|nr:hypothetical protein NHX12_028512 [Muraenolepis orangiensis]